MSSEGGGVHIKISRLWQHSQELYAEILTTTEWHHLMRCELCGQILREFYKSKSVQEANETVRLLGIEANLEEGEETA
jgi:hypothetical protein